MENLAYRFSRPRQCRVLINIYHGMLPLLAQADLSSADGEKLRKLQAQSKAAADILFRKKRDLQHAATDVEEVRLPNGETTC